jgi:hypothetical protein
MFLVKDNVISDKFKNSLTKLFQSNKLNYTFSTCATEVGDGGFHFIHDIYSNNKRKKTYKFFKSLVTDILNKQNISFSEIHRMAINITFNNGRVKEVPLHTDHSFPHNQIILYLTDSDGDTVIPKYNASISPLMNRAIIFEGIEHKHYFPTKGVRIVFVCTFS